MVASTGGKGNNGAKVGRTNGSRTQTTARTMNMEDKKNADYPYRRPTLVPNKPGGSPSVELCDRSDHTAQGIRRSKIEQGLHDRR